MSKMHVINADEATKAAVVAYAAERGISQTKALAELVRCKDTSLACVPALNEPIRRLLEVAAERSQSPAETLSAALDALAAPWLLAAYEDHAASIALPALSPAIVQPAEKLVRTWCGCDGEDGPGPWHRLGCEKRTA